ncbi:hypothetical protein KY328_03770, partial [Candidatus Woesearchaeota archaeon]|nr:hypothetical protein [Candidatus Woesearchaeota archaeon]
QDMNPELTAPPPDGNGVYRCMKGALDRAGLNPEDIDLVIAHGTSTPHGDEAEVFAILQLFKGCGGYRGSNTPPIISTKGIVGHTIATSGIVSVIAAKDAMLKGYIPGNNVVNIDPRFKYADIVTEKRENQNIKYVLINACAFGGQNVSIVLEKP